MLRYVDGYMQLEKNAAVSREKETADLEKLATRASQMEKERDECSRRLESAQQLIKQTELKYVLEQVQCRCVNQIDVLVNFQCEFPSISIPKFVCNVYNLHLVFMCMYICLHVHRSLIIYKCFVYLFM